MAIAVALSIVGIVLFIIPVVMYRWVSFHLLGFPFIELLTYTVF